MNVPSVVTDHWQAATVAVVSVAATLALALRRRHATPRVRPPAAVWVAAFAAVVCTAYSADTSWRFAEHHLGMTDLVERGAMFAAAELALLACALMARQNLRERGTPGTPAMLVWAITLVQIIPAYAESGVVGGTVRAAFGPIAAAVLWHLAMGLELWHAKPGALSSSLPAVIGRELRERLLSHLGLATRDRTAEEIARDRATARAVRLASRPNLRAWGKHRLAAAVARSGIALDEQRMADMTRRLAARRGAMELTTIVLPSPFAAEAVSGTSAEPEDTAVPEDEAAWETEPVPPRIVLVPVPDRDTPQLPAGTEQRPELKAVPEADADAEAEPAPARRPTGSKSRKDSKAFDKHVKSARKLLEKDPSLSGAAIGKKLGFSDRYGRTVKDAAIAAPGPAPRTGTEGT